MSLKCGRATLRHSSIQEGLISNSYGSINCHTESPYVDYQWQWPARKDRFQTHHRPPAPHRDASNKQGRHEAWRCWLNTKHNNVEDVGREFESNPASSFAGTLIDTDVDAEVFTKWRYDAKRQDAGANVLLRTRLKAVTPSTALSFSSSYIYGWQGC